MPLSVTVTVTWLSPATVVGCKGVLGVARGVGPLLVGVTVSEEMEAELVPPPLVAVALKV